MSADDNIVVVAELVIFLLRPSITCLVDADSVIAIASGDVK